MQSTKDRNRRDGADRWRLAGCRPSTMHSTIPGAGKVKRIARGTSRTPNPHEPIRSSFEAPYPMLDW